MIIYIKYVKSYENFIKIFILEYQAANGYNQNRSYNTNMQG